MQLTNRKFIFLIAGILLLSLAAAGAIWLLHPSGTQVLVTVNGKEYGTYPLNKDRTVIISPPGSGWHNTLQIRDGHAEIIESDCSNQICVFTPALSEDIVGIIVCLPHGLAVELK